MRKITLVLLCILVPNLILSAQDKTEATKLDDLSAAEYKALEKSHGK